MAPPHRVGPGKIATVQGTNSMLTFSPPTIFPSPSPIAFSAHPFQNRAQYRTDANMSFISIGKVKDGLELLEEAPSFIRRLLSMEN